MSDDIAVSETDRTSVDAAIDVVAGHLNAQHGQLVDAAIWMLDNPHAWQGDGLWTPVQYLCWRAGIAAATAKKIVTIAERAVEFPDCVDALRRGELSLDQVAPITKHAPAWCDRQMAGLAPRCTVAQIAKVARQYPWTPDDTESETESGNDDESTDQDSAGESGETTPSASHPADDTCWFGYDDNGRFRLHLETDHEVGLRIEAALNEARDSLFRAGNADVSDVEAFLEMAERSIDAVESPDRRNRFRTNLHLNVDGTATDGRGRPLPDCIAKHLSCDGVLSPILLEDGSPVSVGRTQHIVPERTRRVVTLRDGGCRVPGCSHDRFIEVHHIVHWSDEGPTDTWNLVCLCPSHHRLHHRGLLGISGDADIEGGIVFTDAQGRTLTESGARPEPPGAPPPPIDGTYAHPLGERLDTRWLYFNDDPARPRRIHTSH